MKKIIKLETDKLFTNLTPQITEMAKVLIIPRNTVSSDRWCASDGQSRLRMCAVGPALHVILHGARTHVMSRFAEDFLVLGRKQDAQKL